MGLEVSLLMQLSGWLANTKSADELELAIVCRIIEAAIWYVTAEAAKMDVASAE
jgi:hypothetical protein